jgi:uncharacterized protein
MSSITSSANNSRDRLLAGEDRAVCISLRVQAAPILAVVLVLCSILLTPVRLLSAGSTGELEGYAGVYQLSHGKFVYVQPWPGGTGQLTYTDDDGNVRALFPSKKNTFTAGPGLLVKGPTQFTFTFLRNSRGMVRQLTRTQAGQPPQTARKLPSYKREPISFQSADEQLAGVLLTPGGKGPYPAMVLIHGSGATDRNNVLPIAQFLTSHGMALLGYDKRGVGASTGDWHSASIEELASDAAAAVDFLRTRKDIDSARIGVFGVSHGGWVAPLAATRALSVSYVISVSGPAGSPAEVDRDHLELVLHENSFSQTDIDRALGLIATRDEAARGHATLETLQAAIENAREEKWFSFVGMPKTADAALIEHWRRLPLDFDPGPVLRGLGVPVLAVFGGLDHTVLPQKNAGAWRAALEAGGAKDFTIRIFPTGNHMLLEARTGEDNEFPLLERFVPEFGPFLLKWLVQHQIVKK